ncbi:MAG: LysR family transcriptional regulator [Rhodospirillaceae bacterium]|nr:LysR family transcriptional regulator [Rhodospirillaceae bacterium]|tara:strand:+ start:6197 stop:7120 length:924 start_codon:yes stop_codon:yes gene_type:complete
MINYTLKHLRYFAAAADVGSVTGAAETCHVSQPSVSAAIAHLEDVFGVQLFVRHHAQGLSLTPAGRRLHASSRNLLNHAEELSQDAEGLAESLEGDLDVGCFVTFAPIVLPGLLRLVGQEHPAIRVRPHELDLRAVQDGLRRGRFELALTYDLNLAPDIDFEAVVTVPLYAALPADHRLAQRSEVSLADLEGEALVLLGLPDSRDHFLSVFSEANIEPVIAYETRSFEMVRGLVANGYGYSVLHSRAPHHRALDGSALVTVPLSEAHRTVHMGIARLASSRPTRMGQAFAQVCREHLPDMLKEQAEA